MSEKTLTQEEVHALAYEMSAMAVREFIEGRLQLYSLPEGAEVDMVPIHEAMEKLAHWMEGRAGKIRQDVTRNA